MSLRFLELDRFRNFASLTLELDSRGAILEAPNGRGKTNFLEAINYLGLFRSFRGAPDPELATFGERGFRLLADADADDGTRRRVGVAVEGARKRVSVDGREGRLAEHVGTLASVVMSPEDIRLVQGSPARRRRYLDVLLALSSRRYLKALQEYRRVLRQRNRVLQAGDGPALLEPWSEQLVRHGSTILAERLGFLERWGGRLGEISARLAGDPGAGLAWAYECSVGAVALHPAAARAGSPGAELPGRAAAARGAVVGIDSGSRGADAAPGRVLSRPAAESAAAHEELGEALRSELARRAPAERRRGMTLAGPHRDDLSIGITDGAPAARRPLAIRSGEPEGPARAGEREEGGIRDLRRFGSQGEQRTAALALRFLEAEALVSERGDEPIVLLDDVFSELDPGRCGEVLAFLAPRQQVFLTSPKPLAVRLPMQLPRYTVEDGRVRRLE